MRENIFKEELDSLRDQLKIMQLENKNLQSFEKDLRSKMKSQHTVIHHHMQLEILKDDMSDSQGSAARKKLGGLGNDLQSLDEDNKNHWSSINSPP